MILLHTASPWGSFGLWSTAATVVGGLFLLSGVSWYVWRGWSHALMRRAPFTHLEALWWGCVARARLHREGLRFTLVTALASGVAYEIGHVCRLANPLVGAVAALLSIQLTSYSTLKAGLSRGFAVLVGMLVALGAYHVAGAGLVCVVGVVGITLAFGKSLGMSDDVVRTVPAMCLSELTLGPSLHTTTVVAYFVATLVGVAVGVLASSFTHRASVGERASAALAALSSEMGALLTELGEGTRDTWNSDEAATWLRRARELREHVDAAEELVRDAQNHAKVALRASERDVTNLVSLMTVLRLSSGQVIGLARSLFDSAAGDVPLDKLPGLAVSLRRAGRVLNVVADMETGDATPHDLAHALTHAREHASALENRLIDVNDPSLVVAGGAVVTDLSRLVDQLEGSAPVLSLDEEYFSGTA